MDTSSLQFIQLKEDTNLLPFDCGDDDLNNFLFDDAKRYLEDSMAVTYLLIDAKNQQTVAYFSLLNDKITVDAYANVTDFYRKNGFEFFTMTDALDSTRLMYFDLKTVKEQIDNTK